MMYTLLDRYIDGEKSNTKAEEKVLNNNNQRSVQYKLLLLPIHYYKHDIKLPIHYEIVNLIV